MTCLEMAVAVIALCYKHQGSVTSWGRTQKRNKILGGVDNSYHLVFMGIDVVLDEPKQDPAFEVDAEKMGLKAIYEGDHYHLQPK